MILRVRERGELRKIGHTTMASAQMFSLKGAVGFKEKLIRLNGYSKPYPKVVHTPMVGRWPPGGGLDSEFASLRTPAHDRQGFALSGHYARQFDP